MKKILAYTGIGLLLVLFLVTILPFLVSWNQYKTLIENQFMIATGRQLSIQGNLRLALLPSPSATLQDVVITNPSGALSKEFARIKEIEVGLALRPLLSKKIKLTNVVLTKPAITLETMPDGNSNWVFTSNTASADKKIRTENDEEAEDEESAFSVDKFVISDAFIRVINVPKKSQQMIGPIEASFKVGGLQGPFSGRGSLVVGKNAPIRFEAQMDKMPVDVSTPIPFKLGLTMVGGLATADAIGTILRKPEMQVVMDMSVATKALDKLFDPLPAMLSAKTSFAGRMEYQQNKIQIKNLQFNSGGLEASGTTVVDLQSRPQIAIDLENITFPPAQMDAAKSTLPATTQPPIADRLARIFTAASKLLDIALPTLSADIVFTANHLNLPQQPAMRDIRVAASFGDKGMTLQTAEAKMAGDTIIGIKGELPRLASGQSQEAILSIQFSTNNISALSGKASGTAQPLSLQTTAYLTRDYLKLDPINFVQKGETVNGALTYQPKSETALTVSLKGQELNIDALLGKQKTDKVSGDIAQAPATSDDPLKMLHGLKAKLNFDLARVIYTKRTAKSVQLDATVTDQGIVLTQARIGDLGGLVVTAQGGVAGFNPLRGVSLTAEGQTPNLSQTLQALGNDNAKNLGASQFKATLQGDDETLNISLQSKIDQGDITIKAVAKDIAAIPKYVGKISVTHPETATIVRNFLKLQPRGTFGAFLLQSNFVYGTKTLQASDLLIKLGNAGTLKGNIDIKPQDSGRSINTSLQADRLDLSALMGDAPIDSAAADKVSAAAVQQPWSQAPLKLDSFSDLNGQITASIDTLLYKKFQINQFKTDIAFDKGTANIKSFRGQLFDAGTFSLTGNVAAGQSGAPHKGDVKIAIDQTDAKKLFEALGSKLFNQGAIDAKQTLRFQGNSPASLVASLQGDGTIAVTKAVMNGIDLDALAAKLDRPNSLGDFAAILDQARAGGQTTIGDVTIPLTIQSGVVRVQDVPIKTQRTAMMVKGLVNLPDKQVDLLGQITFVEQKNLPALTLLVKGPLSAPQKSFDTRAFTQFFAQKATDKLQQKLQDKLGGILGAPQTNPVPQQPVQNPTALPAPVPLPPAVAPPSAEQQKQDAIKQLGSQLLNNLFSSPTKP